MKGPGFLIVMGVAALLWWEPGLIGVNVSGVDVEGRCHLSHAFAESLLSPYIGKSMGISTCRSLERAFLRLSIVETATVTRSWPDTLSLVIQERRLVARSADTGTAFDSRGNRYSGLRTLTDSLPELKGWSIEAADQWVSTFQLLKLAQDSYPDLFQAAVVAEPPQHGALTILARDSLLAVVLPCPPDDALQDRLEYLPIVLADARSKGDSPRVVDIRWSNQIVFGSDETQEGP